MQCVGVVSKASRGQDAPRTLGWHTRGASSRSFTLLCSCAQAIAVMRALKLSDDDERVNPNGGAIALGHPLGMSGARLALTAMRELQLSKERFALCTMCIGVGQGISMLIERV